MGASFSARGELLCLVDFELLELSELIRSSQRAVDVARRMNEARGATIGATAAKTPRTSSRSMPSSEAAPRFTRYEAGGASTATSAAIRTSMSSFSSSVDASIESLVIVLIRSRTGVLVTGVTMALLSLRCHRPRYARPDEGHRSSPVGEVAGAQEDNAPRRCQRRPTCPPARCPRNAPDVPAPRPNDAPTAPRTAARASRALVLQLVLREGSSEAAP